MKKLIILAIAITLLFNVTSAETICGLPKPTNLEITKSIILGEKIKNSSITCLKNSTDDADAEYWLALFIFNNIGNISQDKMMGFDYIKRSSEKNHNLALNAMGNYYENGWFVEKNPDIAITYYKIAANQGSVDAMDNLSKLLLSSKNSFDRKQGVDWAEKSAQNGSKLALQNLGLIYGIGLGDTPIDNAKAFDFFLKAAEYDDMIESQANLGFLYASKLPNITYDEDNAKYWISKAALNGSIEAYNTLGIFYYLGIGFEKNNEKSFHMFKLAAENNNIYGQINLARFYNYGIGVLVKPKRTL